MDTHVIYRDVSFLNPEFEARVRNLDEHLSLLYQTGVAEFRLKVFETYRSPARQLHLLSKAVTKAGPWQSPHQYGLAVDFVPYLTEAEADRLDVPPGWHWPEVSNGIWHILHEQCAVFGVKHPISWDKPHCEDPRWPAIQRALKNK